METFFAIGVGAYGATTAGYLASLWSARPELGRMAAWLLRGSLVFWGVLLVAFAIQAGVGGSTRLWLGVSGWSLGALYLFLLRRHPITALGSFVSALATVLASLALLMHRPSAALTDPTWGAWILRIHIGLAFIGVTAFGFATAVSLVYLLQARALKSKRRTGLRKRLPPLEVLDSLSLRSIIVGFPFYTVALLLGSAQAVRGEGGVKLAYILACVSWAIYGAVLQARLTAGWRGRRAAILTAVGLVATLGVVALYSLGAP
ncbi:MAG: cytochrome c biogenesis protein CcsA [Myxococcales bacterium]|nr:cytochrome c biogenesis protein CcsA [Myxococcales bacterium]MCB9524878.1 cytochrome c biogenesis protein CcsA [Myxococcales bacterium]